MKQENKLLKTDFDLIYLTFSLPFLQDEYAHLAKFVKGKAIVESCFYTPSVVLLLFCHPRLM